MRVHVCCWFLVKRLWHLIQSHKICTYKAITVMINWPTKCYYSLNKYNRILKYVRSNNSEHQIQKSLCSPPYDHKQWWNNHLISSYRSQWLFSFLFSFPWALNHNNTFQYTMWIRARAWTRTRRCLFAMWHFNKVWLVFDRIWSQ